MKPFLILCWSLYVQKVMQTDIYGIYLYDFMMTDTHPLSFQSFSVQTARTSRTCASQSHPVCPVTWRSPSHACLTQYNICSSYVTAPTSIKPSLLRLWPPPRLLRLGMNGKNRCVGKEDSNPACALWFPSLRHRCCSAPQIPTWW